MRRHLQLLRSLNCALLLIPSSSQAPQLQTVLEEAKSNYEAKIYDFSDLQGYWTELKIGTPPQTFKVLLDFSWSRLFLPSVQCSTSLCRPYGSDGGPNLFNESASKAFVPSDNRSSVSYLGACFKGNLGNDVANLAGITVAQQEFLDAADVSAPGYFTFYRFYDGVLGLAPFDPSNASDLTTYPSLFKSMGRTPGSLRFGQPRLIPNAENVITLPLSEESIPDQTWYSPGTDMDWDNGNIQAQIGPNYPIEFNPFAMAIHLPRPLASIINQQIGLSDDDEENRVDCEGREKLPSLVFTFRGGARLEIAPLDYTLEWRFENGTLMGV